MYFQDGRTPLQVADELKMIPFSGRALCTKKLKVDPFKKWVKEQQDDMIIYIGFTPYEKSRIKRRQEPHKNYNNKEVGPRGYHAMFKHVLKEEYPLLWGHGVHYPSNFLTQIGVEIPLPYFNGHEHNNCHSIVCVKAGLHAFILSYYYNHEGFMRVMEWEAKRREEWDNPRTILKRVEDGVARPFPLTELKERIENGEYPKPDKPSVVQLSMIDAVSSCVSCSIH